ncbi:disease resistance protein Roq1-like [Bidens hawaiensis]|uniref:disease resistance protein Roq1-like n=1 Tax=Bidens hawaiensis TaxID=980011 RepID=UPI00404B4781
MLQKKEIVEVLKISYDGLESDEKAIFLDIAYFFPMERGKSSNEACGYHPTLGIKVLQQKALITIVDGKFDMHDLIQEMGHNIVRGEHPNNPAKHSRVWKDEEIINMCHGDATMEECKTKAIQNDGDPSLFCKILSSMKRPRWLSLTKSDNYNVWNVYRNDDPSLFHVSRNGDPSLFRKILSSMKRLSWLSLTKFN